MKKHLILILLFLSANFVKGQTIPFEVKGSILKQAIEMGNLLLRKEYEAYINTIYPPLIAEAGGKEKFLDVLNSGLQELKRKGIVIDTVKFLLPNEIIQIENELQTTMSEFIVMTVPQGKMIAKSTLIVISYDSGQKWYFLDTSDKDLKTIQKQYPNLSDNLVILPFGLPNYSIDPEHLAVPRADPAKKPIARATSFFVANDSVFARTWHLSRPGCLC